MPQYREGAGYTYTFPENGDIRPYATYSGSIPHNPGNISNGLHLQISPSGSRGRVAQIVGYHYDTCNTANKFLTYAKLRDAYGDIILMRAKDWPTFFTSPVTVTFPLYISGSITNRTGRVSVFGRWT
jgi:hypothetical protein